MIEFKGRNGYVKYGEREVLPIDRDTIHVGFYSTRRGGNPPCVFEGETTELAAFFRKIADEVEQAGRPAEQATTSKRDWPVCRSRALLDGLK